MKAHDVRGLRYCEQCRELVHKNVQRCIECCWDIAGGVEEFTRRFPREDWAKLPLGLIGAENMRLLLARIES